MELPAGLKPLRGYLDWDSRIVVVLVGVRERTPSKVMVRVRNGAPCDINRRSQPSAATVG